MLLILIWRFSYNKEINYENKSMKRSLLMFLIFFVISEFLLFGAFFWCWWDTKWHLRVYVGNLLFVKGALILNRISVPLLNTCILLRTALFIRRVHHNCINRKTVNLFILLVRRLLFIFQFLAIQYFEFKEIRFSLRDRITHGLLFSLISLHGFHIILCFSLIFISLLLFIIKNFDYLNHLFLDLTIYYFHLVDVVWLLLLWTVYFLLFSI